MIKIKKIKNEHRVYNGTKKIGTLRKCCCGIDFRPNYNENYLFSILSVKFGTPELKKCIEVLAELDLPKNGRFRHVNFSYKTATNPERLEQYKKAIGIN